MPVKCLRDAPKAQHQAVKRQIQLYRMVYRLFHVLVGSVERCLNATIRRSCACRPPSSSDPLSDFRLMKVENCTPLSPPPTTNFHRNYFFFFTWKKCPQWLRLWREQNLLSAAPSCCCSSDCLPPANRVQAAGVRVRERDVIKIAGTKFDA